MNELMEKVGKLLNLESELENLDTETLVDTRAETEELIQELDAQVFNDVEVETIDSLKRFKNDITVVIQLRDSMDDGEYNEDYNEYTKLEDY